MLTKLPHKLENFGKICENARKSVIQSLEALCYYSNTGPSILKRVIAV